MTLSDIFKSQHDENNEWMYCSLKREQYKKQQRLTKLAVDSSKSIVKKLSLLVQNLKQNFQDF
ncbi:hypothetical protein [Alphaproteobacteria bacterium endosymbiont of Tiliacea citrago]|uniref:hypothetical protein n=1 Tax=Alphaproteobacteria bacterium endosymbiont of Tiliacea citrago TaxID=3077944 RepID=UPI00313BE3A3